MIHCYLVVLYGNLTMYLVRLSCSLLYLKLPHQFFIYCRLTGPEKLIMVWLVKKSLALYGT